MAEISIRDKAKIEKFLGMGGGYVADFSNRTFHEFVGVVTDIDINDTKYHYASNSKANRLRQFMKVESDTAAARILSCGKNINQSREGIRASAIENLHSTFIKNITIKNQKNGRNNKQPI